MSIDDGLIHEIDDAMAEVLDRAMQYGDAERVGFIMSAAGLGETRAPEQAPVSVPVRALSLAVAQKCNLGCTYCYAQQGNFGGADSSMPIEVAKASVDRLLADAEPGENITIAYLGGEPLVNRTVLQEATRYAADRAASLGINVAFALTTNATLLTADDAAFFDRHGFTVTVSIDGVGAAHDALRPFKSGRGSYDRIIERSKLLLLRPHRRSQVIARVSVTPRNLGLPETLDELARLGFDGVSFSPVLKSPAGSDQMGRGEFDAMLARMIACAETFEQRLMNNEIYPFLNIINTLRRIHKPNRDAYPCGAGGGYLGVSSKGDLFACHRFVDDDLGAMGNVSDGVDGEKQQRWLSDRNVQRQEPCRTCWARHQCGGGCHHEVIHRGRPACDYIRGWLHYCLGVYARLMEAKPPLLHQVLNSQAHP
ncbi:radical SAM/SPASM domain-containing protein [Bradyrhizobium sp.]|uniref:radical SAM/SPASM domain-containing protein n=1 Tax=Bradyrhizobium sp. TaxID=376 RepID=UPI002DFBCFA3|nr:radical SAM protein [Bradyrhizobium sp.]